MEELYINNIQAELMPNTVARTLQVNDLAEVKDRQANYSNTIKLPRTTKNIAIMEGLGIMGSTTRVPYENVVVKYIVDGIELVSEGKGVLKQSNSFFDLVVYDGNISMKDLFGNEQLNTVDFTSLNHTLTESTFVNSFPNTSGYIYGMGRYYYAININVFPIEFMSPSIYVHTLIEMLFAEKGYTITGSCLTDASYLRRVTSMNNGFERNITETQTQVYDRDNTTDPLIVSNSLAPNIAKNFIIDTYVATTLVNHTINLNGFLTINKGSEPRILVNVNGSTQATHVIDGSFNVDIDLQMEPGETIDIVVAIAGDDSTDIEFSTEYITTINENLLSIPIDFSELIGTTKKIDFIKDIMQHYGFVFRKVPNSNVFEFKCIKEILLDKANAEDWSEKYSRVLNEVYKPKYAKKSYAKYTYDDADTEQTFADGIIQVDNENLKLETTMFTSLFKASKLITTIYYELFHWVDEEEDNIVSQVPNDDGLRTFEIFRTTTTVFYKYRLTAGNNASVSGDIPILYFPSYQLNLNHNYLEFQEMLKNYKSPTLELNLSTVDIYHLDFFKLKYFKQLGQYYYLNKVKGHKPNKTVKVELIQVGADIDPYGEIDGVSVGTSTDTATLTKNLHGEIDGVSEGVGTDTATLTKISITSFSLGMNGVTEGEVCDETVLIERWHKGLGADPSIGDAIFTDALGTIPFNGNTLYWKLAGYTYIRVGFTGIVTEKSYCF